MDHVERGRDDEEHLHQLQVMSSEYWAALVQALSAELIPDLHKVTTREEQARKQITALNRQLAAMVEEAERWETNYQDLSQEVQALPHVPTWIRDMEKRLTAARQEAVQIVDMLERQETQHKPV